jgi:hypothetical protein
MHLLGIGLWDASRLIDPRNHPRHQGGASPYGRSSDGHDEQSRIVLPPETGEQPSLSSGWSDAPCLNRRRPGSLSLNTNKSSSSSCEEAAKRLVMRSPCAGAVLDPPVWTVVAPNTSKALSLSLSLSLSSDTPAASVPRHKVCVFITAVPVTKLFAWGEGDSGGSDMCYERRRAGA